MSTEKGKPFLEGDLLGSQHMTEQEEEKLQRSLTNRHIQMIAIGGAIGTGLFMGSGKTLSVSGTSIILTYLIIGFFFFFVMRAMGELLLANTNFKTFADFATAYLGPWAGFFLGWSYWCNWIITAIADVIVIGGYMQFWYPDMPVWIPAFASLAILTILNFVAVRMFGELEFWFSLIKIVAIILFICATLVNQYLPAYWAPANNVWTRIGAILACIIVALGLLYATHQGKGFIHLLKDARVELRRVTWPTKQETVTTSWQVVLVVVIASIVLWCFDYALGWLVKLIIG